jgi:hypothetical protein
VKEKQVVISMYDVVKAFKTKLRLWERQLNSGNRTHFNMYKKHQNTKSNSTSIGKATTQRAYFLIFMTGMKISDHLRIVSLCS